MQPAETITVEELRFSCDGGDGALGHPRIFLTIPPAVGAVDCPYCGRHFVLKPGAAIHGHDH